MKVVIGCTNSCVLAKKIARKLKVPYKKLVVRHFPDGELYIKFPVLPKNKHVIIVQSMYPNPNAALLEAVWAAQTAQELKARKVTVIAPYLCYLRQDKRFHPTEAKSNTIMSALLTCADSLLTIDPHLHRIKSLKEIFEIQASHTTANTLLGEYIKKKIRRGIVIGPDGESYQWAEQIAKTAGLPVHVLKKKRYSSRKVRIVVPQELKKKLRHTPAILVDDIVSTGHTLLEVVKQLRKHGTKKIYALAVHGVFAENALQKLRKARVKVITTNTINNKVAKIDVSGLIAKNL
jgi:ribose-phosphate pyrophosphokinase